jgi:hypothetical protein
VEPHAHRAAEVGDADDDLREQESRPGDQRFGDVEVAVDALRVAPVDDEAEVSGEPVGEEFVQ